MLQVLTFGATVTVIQCTQGSIISRLVNYTADGDPPLLLTGYISYPSNVSKPPGIVIAHDWDGRDQFEDRVAEELAKLGYIAFAYDIYGEKGTGPNHNRRLLTPFTINRTLLIERVKLAFEQIKLNADKKLDLSKLGILGYCFGGLAVLDAARNNLPGLRAAVVFHGLLNPPKGREKDDTAIRIPKFETEMTARSADWQLIVYGNTDHSFTVPGQPLYRKQSADRAWNATVSFLAEAFA